MAHCTVVYAFAVSLYHSAVHIFKFPFSLKLFISFKISLLHPVFHIFMFSQFFISSWYLYSTQYYLFHTVVHILSFLYSTQFFMPLHFPNSTQVCNTRKIKHLRSRVLLIYYTSPSYFPVSLSLALSFSSSFSCLSMFAFSFSHISLSFKLPFFPFSWLSFSLRRKCIFAKFIQYFLENALSKCVMTFSREIVVLLMNKKITNIFVRYA